MDYRKTGEAPLDQWSSVHFASGWLMGQLCVSPLLFLASVIGFEVLEAFLRHNPDYAKNLPKGFIENESVENVTADIILGVLGYVIGSGGCCARGRAGSGL